MENNPKNEVLKMTITIEPKEELVKSIADFISSPSAIDRIINSFNTILPQKYNIEVE